MGAVELHFEDTRLQTALMRDPTGASVTDCRAGSSQPFVSINVVDKQVCFKAYLQPVAAESLTKELVKLFPQPAAEPPFDAVTACQKLADYLSDEGGGLDQAQHLAFAVLRQACQEQDEEHNTLTEARA